MQQSGLAALGWTLCKHELETQLPLNMFFNLLPVIHQPDNCAEGVGRPGSSFLSRAGAASEVSSRPLARRDGRSCLSLCTGLDQISLVNAAPSPQRQ